MTSIPTIADCTCRRVNRRSVVLAGLALGGAFAARAQDFPARTIRVISPYAPGAGAEAVLRVVMEKVARAVGQQVIIENRPGANGVLAAEQAKRAPADGYTLLQMDDAQLCANPHLHKRLSYDPQKDFDPVATLFQTYFFFVVPARSPYRSVADLIDAARARPGQLTHGSWGVGSVSHLGMAQFESLTATQFTHVPFNGTALLPALANGDVDWAFGTAASWGAIARTGKVRYLAAAAPQRIGGFTDVPTVSEAGGPKDFDVRSWVGLLAPHGVPAAVITRMNAEIGKALQDADVRKTMIELGFEPLASGPAEIASLIGIGSKHYATVIRQSKISLD